MSRTAALFAAPLLLASVMSLAPAQAQQERSQRPPDLVHTRMAAAHATVEAVDHAKRTVLLRTDDGRELTLDVPDSVKNFDQVEKGDAINLNYLQATAISLQKAEEAGGGAAGSSAPSAGGPSGNEYRTIKVAPPGEKPSGAATHVVEIAATVEGVDPKDRTITLRGPQGNVRTIDVGEDVRNLANIKKGDQVIVRQTEAIAASITK